MTWSYDYDGLKRLTVANHFAGSSQSSSLTDTEQGIEYDLNGNIAALIRYNSSGLENDLTFLHTGNRMTSLTDANAIGSDAGAKVFTYDANGNLTHDGRKDLDIQWNIFNLASGAVTHDGSLTYARLSDGTLVSSQNTSGNSTTGKRYCGSFVFMTGTGITSPLVESVAWDEGRVFRETTTGAYQDCWFAGDHLGNVRSVVDISPNLSSPVVLEQNDYLPFGTMIANPQHVQMSANRWRYAWKEEFLEMQLLYFGARLYDSYTARWTAVDLMAQKYAGTSPYVYCVNNPLNLVDPNGLDSGDKIIGLFIGGVTNIIPGSGFIRDKYSPSNPQDYNFALEATDKAAKYVGESTLPWAVSGFITGTTMAAMGGTMMLSVVGSSGGIAAASAGVSLATKSVALGIASIVLMTNSSHNQAEGYERGGNYSDEKHLTFTQGRGENAKRVTVTIPKGYKRIKERGKRGAAIFTNGKDYISPDLDDHNGGIWKRAKSVKGLENRETRMGTYDESLIKRIGD